MKKVVHFDQAEKMYVEDYMTFEAIGAELGISERTVRNWAGEGNWDKKRKNFMNFQENLEDDAREITALLGQKIREQLQAGGVPSNHILFTYTRMASSLMKVREYDKSIAADAGNTDEAAKSQKSAAEIFRQTFGVDLTL